VQGQEFLRQNRAAEKMEEELRIFSQEIKKLEEGNAKQNTKPGE
jgi:hypothetical protein